MSNEKSFTCPNIPNTTKQNEAKQHQPIAIGVFLLYSHFVRDLLEVMRITEKSLTRFFYIIVVCVIWGALYVNNIVILGKYVCICEPFQ